MDAQQLDAITRTGRPVLFRNLFEPKIHGTWVMATSIGEDGLVNVVRKDGKTTQIHFSSLTEPGSVTIITKDISEVPPAAEQKAAEATESKSAPEKPSAKKTRGRKPNPQKKK